LLRALEPAQLDLPEAVLAVLLPRPPGYETDARELFVSTTDPAFDALGAAAVAADLVVQAILQPQRCARLVDLHRRDASLPGLDEVVGRLMEAAFGSAPATLRQRRLAETVQDVVAGRLVDLLEQPQSVGVVRAVVEARLEQLTTQLQADGVDAVASAHRRALARAVDRYFREGEWTGMTWRPPAAPPGEPIGNASGCGFSWGG
jgi:hypothetical protein